MENDRLNEIRELNPDYDISMHELDVCVGDNQYRLMYYVYVQHKESGISVYRDKDFDVQEVINRLPSKFTIEILPKGVSIKIHKYSIDCLTGVKHQADSFLFDTNACIFSTSETRELLFSHEEYLILEADTTKVVDGKYPLDYANEIVESNLDTIIDYIVQSGTETYNDRTSRGFGIDNADDLYWWYVTFSIDTTAI